MSTLIRVDEVPAADRLDFVQELTATTWVPTECRALYRTDYEGEFRASGLGAMQVVVMDIMPITVRRTPELISQVDPDMLKMVLVHPGRHAPGDRQQRRVRADLADLSPQRALRNALTTAEPSCSGESYPKDTISASMETKPVRPPLLRRGVTSTVPPSPASRYTSTDRVPLA
jgi:hypothetical protein